MSYIIAPNKTEKLGRWMVLNTEDEKITVGDRFQFQGTRTRETTEKEEFFDLGCAVVIQAETLLATPKNKRYLDWKLIEFTRNGFYYKDSGNPAPICFHKIVLDRDGKVYATPV